MPKRKYRNSQERDGSGKYRRYCGCIDHIDWSFNHVFMLRSIKSSYYGKATISKMRGRGVQSSGTQLLCNACFDAFRERWVPFVILLQVSYC